MCYIFNFSFSIFPHLYIFRFQPNHITSKPHGLSVRFLYSARRGELALLSLTLYKNAGSAPQNRVCCVMMTALYSTHRHEEHLMMQLEYTPPRDSSIPVSIRNLPEKVFPSHGSGPEVRFSSVRTY